MCGQRNCRNRYGRMTRQEISGGNTCGCNPCGCGGSMEPTAPTATISMADYEPFILVPTSVFDQGDVDCGCGQATGQDW